MVQGVNSTHDKNIVDLTRSHRNRAVSKAVRATRERLQSNGDGGARQFERETMVMYLGSLLQSASIMPLFIFMVTGIGVYISKDLRLLVWAVGFMLIHSAIILLARRAEKQEITLDVAQKWHRIFLAMQALSGCGWAYFALMRCEACGDSFVFYKGAILLIAISLTAMTTIMLRPGVLVTFLPVVIGLLIRFAIDRDMASVALTAITATAMVFFLFIGYRFYSANLRILSFQSEKDDLIAELEVAKSLSDEARRRAEEANLAKSRFLASMSHELRTPLNAILGFSEVMATEVLGPLNNPMYKEYSRDIHNSGQHLLNLINEILDLSRIEAGRYDLQESAISLLEIAEDCIGMIQLRARGKSITISEQFEPSLPQLWADEKSIRQVVLNLLSNAVKFTPQGGEIIVKVGWTGSGGQYLAIKDNGPGISEEEIPVVLSAFGQGTIAIKSAEQGTGLGLPIVQAILNKHGGQFLLKSKLREGTEAIAILPAQRVMQSVPAVEEAHAIDRRKKTFA